MLSIYLVMWLKLAPVYIFSKCFHFSTFKQLQLRNYKDCRVENTYTDTSKHIVKHTIDM